MSKVLYRLPPLISEFHTFGITAFLAKIFFMYSLTSQMKKMAIVLLSLRRKFCCRRKERAWTQHYTSHQLQRLSQYYWPQSKLMINIAIIKMWHTCACHWRKLLPLHCYLQLTVLKIFLDSCLGAHCHGYSLESPGSNLPHGTESPCQLEALVDRARRERQQQTHGLWPGIWSQQSVKSNRSSMLMLLFFFCCFTQVPDSSHTL